MHRYHTHQIRSAEPKQDAKEVFPPALDDDSCAPAILVRKPLEVAAVECTKGAELERENVSRCQVDNVRIRRRGGRRGCIRNQAREARELEACIGVKGLQQCERRQQLSFAPLADLVCVTRIGPAQRRYRHGPGRGMAARGRGRRSGNRHAARSAHTLGVGAAFDAHPDIAHVGAAKTEIVIAIQPDLAPVGDRAIPGRVGRGRVPPPGPDPEASTDETDVFVHLPCFRPRRQWFCFGVDLGREPATII